MFAITLEIVQTIWEQIGPENSELLQGVRTGRLVILNENVERYWPVFRYLEKNITAVVAVS